jgi:peptidoglycan/LPS O-acetylase OafA/YrhL
MKEIKPLTSLRGIFALWVLLFHLNSWSPYGVKVIPVIDRGYLAVDFFFVLSGFILANAHGATFVAAYSWLDYAQFAWKRFGRIFPLHWTVLIFYTVGLVALGINLYWWVYIAGEALLIHRWNIGYTSITPLNPPDWSISTEWAANLLFPGFVWAALRGGNLRALSLGIITVFILLYIAAEKNWTLNVAYANSWLPLLRCFSEFSAGLLVFRWRKYLTIVSSDSAITIILFAMICAAWLGVDLISVPLEVALIAGLARNNGYLSELFSKKILQLFGKISFSIYLIQIPVILIFRRIAEIFPKYGILIYVCGTLTGVIGISYFTYYQIEKRWQKISDQSWNIILK